MTTMHRPHSRFSGTPALGILLFLLGGLPGTGCALSANWIDRPVAHPRIPLLDEAGRHVLDTGRPYSTRQSCGAGSGCHDFEKITHAWHFEMGREQASDTYGPKHGQPHLSGPGYFGGFTCVGGNNALILSKKNNGGIDDFADYGAPGLVKTCELCHAGGGFAEFDRNGFRYDQMPEDKIKAFDGDYYERTVNAFIPPGDHGNHGNTIRGDGVGLWNWKKTGVIEPDCLFCHADVANFKAFPASKLSTADLKKTGLVLEQDLRNNKITKGDFFRYVNSGVFEFLNLKPEDPAGLSLLSFERTYASPAAPYNLSLDDMGLPKMHWNAAAFDADGKVAIPMLRYPQSETCMLCHYTSNSRRGFYGMGEESRETVDGTGQLVTDYRDDVHKGRTWTEPGGESRVIDNCNACHARNYFKQASANVDLHADHNWLKGHSDADARNDLDFYREAKSCEYCHQDAATRAIPSGQKTLLDAHRELWKSKGDLDGYATADLTRITQTHFDTVSCQACHITRLEYLNAPLPPFYRYREDKDGKLKIFPYRPSVRYQWHDRSTGRVISNTEYKTVVVEKKDAAGKSYGAIVDPLSGAELAKVSVSIIAGRTILGEPTDVAGWQALKTALDKLLAKKGVASPDVRLLWGESNEYIITHNTRPSPESLQCADCHAKQPSGAFSPLLAEKGLFGTGNVKTVASLLDKRLVDLGIVELGLPYMNVNSAGKITESVGDILAATRSNPSLSMFNLAIAKSFDGEWKRADLAAALDQARIAAPAERSRIGLELGSDDVFQFDIRLGDPRLKQSMVLAAVTPISDAVFPTERLELSVSDAGPGDTAAVAASGLGALASPLFGLAVEDSHKRPVADLHGQTALLKLPYRGTQVDPKQVAVLTRTESGWTATGMNPVVLHPQGADEGYVVVEVSRPYSVLALADPVTGGSTGGSGSAGTGGSAGAGGATGAGSIGNSGGNATGSADAGASPVAAGAAVSADPAAWRQVKPAGSCSTSACRKSLVAAREKLRKAALASRTASAAAAVANARAGRTDLAIAAQARAQAVAARKSARAQRLLEAFQQAAATVVAMRD